jgi:hypothetical protein
MHSFLVCPRCFDSLNMRCARSSHRSWVTAIRCSTVDAPAPTRDIGRSALSRSVHHRTERERKNPCEYVCGVATSLIRREPAGGLPRDGQGPHPAHGTGSHVTGVLADIGSD